MLNLFVEPSEGLVFLCGLGESEFAAEAKGEILPIVAQPAPEPTSEAASAAMPVAPTPVPIGATQTVEALYELFTLLERHEPEWYPRRHSRLAYDALQRAGRIA